VLEMLRRYDVKGAKGYIIEYFGEGVKNLSAWDRHVISNMGTEMGATSSVFPSDERTKLFLKQQGREEDWEELKADAEAQYDLTDSIQLDDLESLIALPSSPGKVVPVKEVADKTVSQVVIGSSANPGYRDFWVVAESLKGKQVSPELSLDINPSSRQTIQSLTSQGNMADLIASGARFHQTGCMGCIGMGQSPATGQISLRTMPRNFPGRSGTVDDQVYLCSPETAVASALTGKITVPSDLKDLYDMKYPEFKEPEQVHTSGTMITPPSSEKGGKLVMGPNIKPIPEFEKLSDNLEIPVILKMGDNVSTDEILKAGAEVLPLRSNIPEISKYAYSAISSTFHERAKAHTEGHVVVAGENYAQGSSREHAALAPRYLGQRAVIAKSYARIGWQNLINFGIIPFEFEDSADYDSISDGDSLAFTNLREAIPSGLVIEVVNETKSKNIKVKTSISSRQAEILLVGGVINYLKEHAEVASVS